MIIVTLMRFMGMWTMRYTDAVDFLNPQMRSQMPPASATNPTMIPIKFTMQPFFFAL